MNIEKGQTALKELMDHWREPVQLAAATQLLPTFNDEALKVLEKLSTREDLTGVTAKTTLKEWHQGTLKSGWLHGILKMFPSQFRFKKITDKNFGSKN